MEYRIVYCDVLFLIDFSMDFLILYLTASLLFLPKKAMRFAVSAALGAVYDVISVIYPGGKLLYVLISIAVSVVLCAIAFSGGNGLLERIRIIVVYYFVNLLFGGAASAVMSFLSMLPDGGNAAEPPAVNRTGLLFLCALGVTVFFLFICRMKSKKNPAQLAVSIVFGGTVHTVDCMVDSGNMLSEPFSGLPVILCNREVFRGNTAALPRKRLVPVHTVSGDTLLDCFIPDKIVYKQNGKQVERAAAVALSDKVIRGGANKNISGLMPSALLEL